jgi:hypothetical protein
MSVQDCIFHANGCPAEKELQDLDRQINMRLKAEAEREKLIDVLFEIRNRGKEPGAATGADAIFCFRTASEILEEMGLLL